MIYFLLPEEMICQMFISFFGLSYIFFFFNLLLSLIDRCVAITEPIYHRQNVTGLFVIFSSFILNLLLAFILNWFYIIGMAPLECEIQLNHSLTALAILILLFTLCVIFLVIDYVITLDRLPHTSGPGVIQIVVDANNSSPMGVHVNLSTAQRLELEATKSFLLSVIPLLLLPLPIVIISLSTLACMYFNPVGDTCAVLVLVANYDNKLISLHALIHPIVLMFKDSELINPSVSTTNSVHD